MPSVQGQATGPGGDACSTRRGADRTVQIVQPRSLPGRRRGQAEKTFAAREVTVPAGKEEVVKLAEAWDNPKLWWPDEPEPVPAGRRRSQLDGKVVDVRHDDLRLPRVGLERPAVQAQRRALAALGRHHAGDGGKDPEAAIALWRTARPEHVAILGPTTSAAWTSSKALDLMDAQRHDRPPQRHLRRRGGQLPAAV